ncbi:hypothetical protein OOK29_05730 [Streptomyces phaeochromogenes]|uniref:SMODS and SLOG-associating 2TM effector domain-containing protein n=1 Tax=Streptomyces phaeochromogenes TaxID=1923 RepID=A0ABZ1HIZ4_STRPH|nr:hypothetical protein [Streptomyces phaeochromogenes]MCX5597636.1 hypothetical protein [Streptomyces phaeochromogenes]WSD18583.1 hypothetical protein OHB35_38100 [Streptomyces phaeochromogenes]
MGTEGDGGRDAYNTSSAAFHQIAGSVHTSWARNEKTEQQDRRAIFVAAMAIALAVSATAILLGSSAGEKQTTRSVVNTFVLGGAIGLGVMILIVAVPWFITRRTYMRNENARIDEVLKSQQEWRHEALEKLKKTTELATLMELNQGQITRYHNIVTEQADKSFKSSRTAMGVGLFLLVVAAVGGAYVPVEEIRWFIGALAAFSTVLTGYLTRTYLAMYKESIGQLNRYFDQPVLNSYYLTAERLIAGLDATHAHEVRCQIINEVLATSSRMGSRPAPTLPKPTAAKPKPKKKPKKQASSMNGTPQA